MDLDHARELKRRLREAAPLTVGISLTGTRSQYRVAVLLTSAKERLVLEAPHVRQLLATAQGAVEIEVVTALPASGTAPAGRRPLMIGASVGHHAGGVGSLGFFARRLSDDAHGLVSCNHVIALGDRGIEGDAVVSPSTFDGRDARVVGFLDGRYPRLASGVADCAFARLAGDIVSEPSQLDDGVLAAGVPEIVTELEVAKVGRNTGSRRGTIKRIEVDNVPVRYGMTKTSFDDVIQIGSTSSSRFCEPGDSGALVYTADTFQPVGLLFATSHIGGPFDAGWTWAHPIRRVTTALGVEILVS